MTDKYCISNPDDRLLLEKVKKTYYWREPLTGKTFSTKKGARKFVHDITYKSYKHALFQSNLPDIRKLRSYVELLECKPFFGCIVKERHNIRCFVPDWAERHISYREKYDESCIFIDNYNDQL